MISKIFGDYQRNVWKDKKEINYEQGIGKEL